MVVACTSNVCWRLCGPNPLDYCTVRSNVKLHTSLRTLLSSRPRSRNSPSACSAVRYHHVARFTSYWLSVELKSHHRSAGSLRRSSCAALKSLALWNRIPLIPCGHTRLAFKCSIALSQVVSERAVPKARGRLLAKVYGPKFGRFVVDIGFTDPK